MEAVHFLPYANGFDVYRWRKPQSRAARWSPITRCLPTASIVLELYPPIICQMHCVDNDHVYCLNKQEGCLCVISMEYCYFRSYHQFCKRVLIDIAVLDSILLNLGMTAFYAHCGMQIADSSNGCYLNFRLYSFRA